MVLEKVMAAPQIITHNLLVNLSHRTSGEMQQTQVQIKTETRSSLEQDFSRVYFTRGVVEAYFQPFAFQGGPTVQQVKPRPIHLPQQSSGRACVIIQHFELHLLHI